jgi:thiamine phosphate synthase YjbQ (UPF0047 family)
MNIFYLADTHEANVAAHLDKHVVKMLVEYTQLLSTAVRESGIDAGYKTTHKNHPSAIWARESLDNWLWLRDLTAHLNEEYKYRYGHTKNHKSYDMMMTLPLPNILSIGITKFRLAMPDDVRMEDPIESYRAYYKKYKSHIAKWKKRDVPEWYK